MNAGAFCLQVIHILKFYKSFGRVDNIIMHSRPYVAIFLVIISAVFLTAGFAFAAPTEWIKGNFKYVITPDGVQVTQIQAPLQNATPTPTPTSTSTPTPTPTPTTQSTLDIVSVSSISDINVDYGTALSAANLPTTVTATMSDNSTQSMSVTWDNGTPTYDPNTAGAYVFSGALTLSDNTTNTNNVKASANVIVAAEISLPTSPSLEQTTSPSTGGSILDQATSSLINGVENFFNFIFLPIKNLIHVF